MPQDKHGSADPGPTVHSRNDSPKITPENVKAELERILSSEDFRQSNRLQQFLRYIVSHTLEKDERPLKEYLIGVEVFGRKESFDPRLDPIVRVEAGRLRKRLKHYYETTGQSDSARIELPKRTYMPVFVAGAGSKLSHFGSKRLWAGLAATTVFLFAGITLHQKIRLSQPIQANSSRETRGILPGEAAVGRLDPAAVAVLPFVDLSPEQDQEYFCEGLTEELMNSLARVEGLRVVPRTSSFRFMAEGQDVRKIGQQLAVGTVLEGSVRKSGKRLRVTVQAIDVVNGFSLWAGTYDKLVSDVFTIQSDIAAAVVKALKDRINNVLTQLASLQTKDVDAFNLYLLGRYQWNKRTEQSLIKAIGYFEAALTKDSRYALAYSGIADSYALLVNYGSLPPREAMLKAKAAALKALDINESLSEAHASLAYVLTYYEWNWLEAEHHFRRALELSPHYSDAHQWYGAYLHLMERHEEAERHFRRASEIDPLSVMLNYRIALNLYGKQRYSESMQQCRKVIDLDPNFPRTYRLLGRLYEQQGEFDEAIEMLEKGRTLSGGKPQYTALIARSHARAGREREARELLSRLLRMARERYVFAVDIASVYMSLGEREEALRWLEQAYQERSPWLPASLSSRQFEPLKSDPRFISLHKRLGLPLG